MNTKPLLPDPHTSRVVLLGVSDYDHLEDLPAVGNSLLDFTEALRSPELWGIPRQNSRMLHNPGAVEEVLDAVRRAAAEARDTLLLYYAGHGLPDPYSGELNLALTGSDPEKQESLLAYEWLRRPLLASRAKRRIVILDSCYSGRILPKMLSGRRLAEKAGIEGVFLMAASASNREALSPPGQRHTAFSGELLRILREGVPEAGLALDLRTIFGELDMALTRRSLPRPQSNNRNTAAALGLVWNRHHFSAVAEGQETAGHRGDVLLIDGFDVGEILGNEEERETWLATDSRTQRPVAITALRAESAGDPAARERFHVWRRSLPAGESHPSIVAVYASGEARHWRGPRPYVVTEYLPATLRELLDSSGMLPLGQAVSVIRTVLEALRHAQETGRGHGVLAPESIRIGHDGHAKVTRFHRPVAEPDHDPSAALPVVAGPIHYASPEQVTSRASDARTDVYAAACLFCELLSGAPPFVGAHAVAIAYQHMTVKPPRMSARLNDLPPRWDPFFRKALAKDPDDRYRNAESMLEALVHRVSAPSTLAEEVIQAFREPRLTVRASTVDGNWVLGAFRACAEELATGAPGPGSLELRLLLPRYDADSLLASQRALLRADSEDAVRALRRTLDALVAAGHVGSVDVRVRRASSVSTFFVLGERLAFAAATRVQPLQRFDARSGEAEAHTVRDFRAKFASAWRAAPEEAS
ncbi:caspase, EACC1-associated type [Streptomyces sp. cmx-18-6]|uniref:caspase, EACC1-associated type n=1 Tax=Streptomyces sp. cmx-18-6 TaxID=2790930 RepID=UPI00397F7821